ncbi:MAG TPA: class I SAM-dependent RNA methyltransferase [Bryobacteraceae bacterium]|nr:class I SAM-dependent RNA methyltransferase [Bryobacteraceae bacterium]
MPLLNTELERHRVTVEKLIYGGDALARIDGQAVFIPFALPGEEVEVRTSPGKGKSLRGLNTRVFSASAQRVQPGCEYFGHCGGCQYQHADYAYQLEQKVAILRETLARLGKITIEQEIPVIKSEPWGYRNRVKLHFERGKVGYREAELHKLCAIGHCPISSPRLNAVIAALNDAVKRREWPSFVSGLEVFTNETDVQFHVTETARPVAKRFFSWCAGIIPGFQPDSVTYESSGQKLRISRGTFFQVNRFLIDPLVQEVMGDYEGRSAIDLYAGAGLFSLPLSRRFASLTAVERSAPAYHDLGYNAEQFGRSVTAIKTTSDEFLARFDGTADLIVADPPRAGLTRTVTSSLLRIQSPRIIIVSCDPATLARDLESLSRAYAIRRIALIDLFPQTYHFETVVHLELKR